MDTALQIKYYGTEISLQIGNADPTVFFYKLGLYQHVPAPDAKLDYDPNSMPLTPWIARVDGTMEVFNDLNRADEYILEKLKGIATYRQEHARRCKDIVEEAKEHLVKLERAHGI